MKQAVCLIGSLTAGQVRAMLEKRLGKPADRGLIAVPGSPDPLDIIVLGAEVNLAVSQIEQTTAVKKEIRAAIRRIDDGSFGSCVDCEKAIPQRRLEVVPWAARCVPCQEAEDGRRERVYVQADELAFAS